MSKQRKFRQQKKQVKVDRGLPVSVIIPEAENPEQISLFLESFQKIRNLHERDFELIFSTGDEKTLNAAIEANERTASLREKGKIIILRNEEGQSESPLRSALEAGRHENLMIFDLARLERSFNFDELFHIPEQLISDHHIVHAVFRE